MSEESKENQERSKEGPKERPEDKTERLEEDFEVVLIWANRLEHPGPKGYYHELIIFAQLGESVRNTK